MLLGCIIHFSWFVSLILCIAFMLYVRFLLKNWQTKDVLIWHIWSVIWCMQTNFPPMSVKHPYDRTVQVTHDSLRKVYYERFFLSWRNFKFEYTLPLNCRFKYQKEAALRFAVHGWELTFMLLYKVIHFFWIFQPTHLSALGLPF